MKKFMQILTGTLLSLAFSTHVWGAVCQPQCVTYSREQSGIYTCRVGANGTALDWFACEEKADRTTSKPDEKRVLIAKVGTTGHSMTVKKSKSLGKNKWDLTLSHTNYDGHCSKETNCKARFDRDKMTLAITSGAWKGKTLKVKGFIKK